MHPLEIEVHEMIRNPMVLEFFERAANGMWIWDLTLDGNSWVSPAFAATFGYTPEEITHGAEFWEKICHPEDWGRAMEDVQNAIAENSIYDNTTRVRHKDGHWVWVRSIGMMLYDEEGAPHRGFGIQYDISDVMNAKELAERQNQRDPLTDLLNRRGLEDVLVRSLARSDRDGTRVYAAILDLDDFKRVNEEHGHACGDALLKAIAQRFTNTLRAEDAAARIGGDEFCIVYSCRRRSEALASLHRVAEGLSHEFIIMNKVLQAQFSAALVRVHKPDINSILLSVVDSLHAAKHGGKGQVVHTPSVFPTTRPGSRDSYRIHSFPSGASSNPPPGSEIGAVMKAAPDK